MLTPHDVTEMGAGGWGRSERNRRDRAVWPRNRALQSWCHLLQMSYF